MEATLILAVLVPTFSMLSLVVGGTLVYLVMTQQRILALEKIPKRTQHFYNVEDKYAGGIIIQHEEAGFDVVRESFKRNRRSGFFDFTMTLEA